MPHLLHNWLAALARTYRRFFQSWTWRRYSLIWLFCFGCVGAGLGLTTSLAQAQSNTVQQQEDQVIREFVLPNAPSQAPVVRPRPNRSAPPQRRTSEPNSSSRRRPDSQNSVTGQTKLDPSNQTSQVDEPAVTADVSSDSQSSSQYILAFNRSPVVGNRFRLQGIYSEARLGFTRPRSWKMESAKALIRFQHSPALLANQSNLTVRVNGTSIGSVPLNRRQSEIGQVLFNIPPNLIQDFNDLSVIAQQHNSATCTDPGDPTLWTEVLPDSKILFDFQPQPIALDFSRYPYPFLDNLALEPNRLAYLRPKELSESWLTAAARLQASMGRIAEFRPLETRLVTSLDQVAENKNERLVIIGTPAEQPALANLVLPFPLAGGQILDGNRGVLPGDVGVLMMATTKDSGVPVLVATGNDAVGVAKAVQALVQPKDRQLSTGQAVVVSSVTDVPPPPARQWSNYLPLTNSFKLSDLSTPDGKPFQDVTVKGSYPPAIQVNFRALPDDQFVRGNTMTLDYSYSPQANPRTSAVEVRLDDVAIAGKQLTSKEGGRDTFSVALPENLIKPTSVLGVQFNLVPREQGSCGKVVDQQLWGTVHADSRFNLKRENVVQLPDLKLLQTGFPLTAPQDLSQTAVILPDAPTNDDVATLLTFSERMGRISKADSIKLEAYLMGTVPVEVRNQRNLVGIGTRDQFPLPEVFEAGGLKLGELFGRQRDQSQIQTLPDDEGVVKSVLSPWNGDRILLALTAQTKNGLSEVRNIFKQDPLFFQMQGDTVLISSNQPNSSVYDPDAYNMEFLQQAPQKQIDRSDILSRASRFLQANWFLLPTGIVMLALVAYGISQLYLNRLSKTGEVK